MSSLGQITASVAFLGEFTLFVGHSIVAFRRIFHRLGLFLGQCEYIGVSSIGILMVAAVFMGAVLGYQLYISLHMFGAEALLGGSVGVALFRELAPVMTAIMVTGRAGAAMAAEIASMRISEQIDALEVMAVDPFEYLVAPRVLASTLMLPLLSVFFGGVATLSASVIACSMMGLPEATFWSQFTKVVDPIELVHCMSKGFVFGAAFSCIGCFYGYRADGGARGVGFAARTTVVASVLLILLSDYIMTSLLPYGFSYLQV